MSHAVVLSGYNGGHGISYTDYEGLEGYPSQYEGHAVLPTVAVPVHAVSASPVHVTATLDHGSHGYDHHADHHGHDYYVSYYHVIVITRICPLIFLITHNYNFYLTLLINFVILSSGLKLSR